MTEKNKSIPVFAGHLAPDEAIVWTLAPSQFQWDSLWANLSIRRFYVVAIGVAALAIILACIVAGQTDLIPMLAGATLVALGLALGPALVEIGLLRAYSTIRNPPQKDTFAVTNQRILQLRGKQLHTLPLERVPPIVVFGKGSRGTLSFGAMFPMWTNVENPENVKAIIEKAQKERLKAIQK